MPSELSSAPWTKKEPVADHHLSHTANISISYHYGFPCGPGINSDHEALGYRLSDKNSLCPRWPVYRKLFIKARDARDADCEIGDLWLERLGKAMCLQNRDTFNLLFYIVTVII
jgi:hypothetical protein